MERCLRAHRLAAAAGATDLALGALVEAFGLVPDGRRWPSARAWLDGHPGTDEERLAILRSLADADPTHRAELIRCLRGLERPEDMPPMSERPAKAKARALRRVFTRLNSSVVMATENAAKRNP